VLHVKSCQTVIAALHEKDEKDNKEEVAFITHARCQKNAKKSKK
jgi:hypothetical protein